MMVEEGCPGALILPGPLDLARSLAYSFTDLRIKWLTPPEGFRVESGNMVVVASDRWVFLLNCNPASRHPHFASAPPVLHADSQRQVCLSARTNSWLHWKSRIWKMWLAYVAVGQPVFSQYSRLPPPLHSAAYPSSPYFIIAGDRFLGGRRGARSGDARDSSVAGGCTIVGEVARFALPTATPDCPKTFAMVVLPTLERAAPLAVIHGDDARIDLPADAQATKSSREQLERDKYYEGAGLSAFVLTFQRALSSRQFVIGPGKFCAWPRTVLQVTLNGPVRRYNGVATHWVYGIMVLPDEWRPSTTAKLHGSSPCSSLGQAEHIQEEQRHCSRELSTASSHGFASFAFICVTESLESIRKSLPRYRQDCGEIRCRSSLLNVLNHGDCDEHEVLYIIKYTSCAMSHTQDTATERSNSFAQRVFDPSKWHKFRKFLVTARTTLPTDGGSNMFPRVCVVSSADEYGKAERGQLGESDVGGELRPGVVVPARLPGVLDADGTRHGLRLRHRRFQGHHAVRPDALQAILRDRPGIQLERPLQPVRQPHFNCRYAPPHPPIFANHFLFFFHISRFSEATVAERLACSPPSKAIRVQSPVGSFRIFACGNRVGRCRWSVGFLGDLPFPPPFHFGTAPYSPQSPSSTLIDLDAKSRLPQITSLAYSQQDRNVTVLSWPSVSYSCVSSIHVWLCYNFTRKEYTGCMYQSFNSALSELVVKDLDVCRKYYVRMRTANYRQSSATKTFEISGNFAYSSSNELDSAVLRVLESKLVVHWMMLKFYSRPGSTAFGNCFLAENRTGIVAGLFGDHTLPPPLHSGAAPYPPRFACVGSQDLGVKSGMDLHVFCETVVCANTHLIYKVQRHDGNTARLARRGDETPGVRASVAHELALAKAKNVTPNSAGIEWRVSDPNSTCGKERMALCLERNGSTSDSSSACLRWTLGQQGPSDVTTLSNLQPCTKYSAVVTLSGTGKTTNRTVTFTTPLNCDERHAKLHLDGFISASVLRKTYGQIAYKVVGTAVDERLASYQGEQGSIPGRATPGPTDAGIVPDDAAGRRVFSGISRLPRPFIPVLLHTHINHPLWLSRPRPLGPPNLGSTLARSVLAVQPVPIGLRESVYLQFFPHLRPRSAAGLYAGAQCPRRAVCAYGILSNDAIILFVGIGCQAGKKLANSWHSPVTIASTEVVPLTGHTLPIAVPGVLNTNGPSVAHMITTAMGSQCTTSQPPDGLLMASRASITFCDIVNMKTNDCVAFLQTKHAAVSSSDSGESNPSKYEYRFADKEPSAINRGRERDRETEREIERENPGEAKVREQCDPIACFGRIRTLNRDQRKYRSLQAHLGAKSPNDVHQNSTCHLLQSHRTACVRCIGVKGQRLLEVILSLVMPSLYSYHYTTVAPTLIKERTTQYCLSWVCGAADAIKAAVTNVTRSSGLVTWSVQAAGRDCSPTLAKMCLSRVVNTTTNNNTRSNITSAANCILVRVASQVRTSLDLLSACTAYRVSLTVLTETSPQPTRTLQLVTTSGRM
ncbi:hypothetical protein PR048_019438 [Dryococelus australis]|uniref:Fibronectin type-III domain-containing protein n=1 Tax=Dryococelus australis TaxID=614101 RepID=A0ABQ9H3H5_9NEOP|nr:hypothetical protein PR048_019438 [Dryococelus australis]